MATSTRLVLLITFVIVALFLHLTICQWSLTWPAGEPLITITTETDRMGLFSRGAIEPVDGLVFGVAAPILLIGLAVALSFEWHSKARALRGGCPGCGYDLRACGHGPCPECGLDLRPHQH